MRKIIAIVFVIALCLLAKAGFTQKKDSTKPVFDTAVVFTIKDVAELKNILMESKVIVNGNQLSGKELSQLFQWIDSKIKVFKKEQPK